MKHLAHFILAVILSGLFLPVSGQQTIKDREGNLYRTILVGNHLWMAENMKASRFQNGDPIPDVKEAKEWKDLKSPAHCDLNNVPENTKKYGRIYNWYTASDPRNICPAGWHVPSDKEWATLTIYLTGEKGPGGVLPEMAALNREVFPKLPEEFRGYDGEFSHIGYGGGGWWSSTPAADQTGYYRGVTYNTAGKQRMEGLKYFGYHIRCVKD
jgi:uncharacterized protein (TIGR02145 family)